MKYVDTKLPGVGGSPFRTWTQCGIGCTLHGDEGLLVVCRDLKQCVTWSTDVSLDECSVVLVGLHSIDFGSHQRKCLTLAQRQLLKDCRHSTCARRCAT